jgi:hypothetical protein
MDKEGPMSSEAAAELWRRAAQLQAEAALRLEERSRALGADHSNGADPQAFSVDEVRAAAVEAGIAPEFITLAIAELQADPAGGLPAELEDSATKFLGTSERSIELSRRIDLPAAQVYAALQRVLPVNPWLLMLRDVSGDPVSGGTMVFEMPSLMTLSGNVTPLGYHAMSVDVQQVHISLRPIEGTGGTACELLVRAGLQRSVRRNFHFARWSAGVSTVFGATVAGLSGVVLAGMSGAIVALPAVAGGALLGYGVMAGYRKLYRHSLQRLTELLGDMVTMVAVHARTGGGFSPLPPAV